MTNPTLSIVVPTRNGAETLPELLAMLTVQTIPIDEIIILDSESEDQTATLAEEFGARLITIKRKDFDHGGTRSLGAKQAKGEIVVFFTQDSIPTSRAALELLIQPFSDNDEIAVCYGRQLPAFNANIFASHLRHFNYPEKSNIRGLDDKEEMGLKTIFVSNSFSAYRKSVLEEVGFFKNGLIFGEDTCTVGRMLLRRKKIAYVAQSSVYHSHNYTMIENFKRYFDIGVLHSMEKWLLDTYGTAEKRGLAFLQSEISLLINEGKYFLLPVSVCNIIVKLIAYKLGRFYSFLPKSLIMLFSMHKSWWHER